VARHRESGLVAVAESGLSLPDNLNVGCVNRYIREALFPTVPTGNQERIAPCVPSSPANADRDSLSKIHGQLPIGVEEIYISTNNRLITPSAGDETQKVRPGNPIRLGQLFA